MVVMRYCLSLYRNIAAAGLFLALTVAAAHGDEHLDALGVLFGFDFAGSWSTTEGGSHFSFHEQQGSSLMRAVAVVTPDTGNPCMIDIASSFHETESSGYLVQTVVDLGKLREVKLQGKTYTQVMMKGDGWFCERELQLPVSASPAKARVSCRSLELWDLMDEERRKSFLAALTVVHKSCPLPGFQP